MSIKLTRVGSRAAHDLKVALRAALALCLLIAPTLCVAQAAGAGDKTPAPAPAPAASGQEQTPLTPREQEMLKLIRSLQERVDKLEAARGAGDVQAKMAEAPAKMAEV